MRLNTSARSASSTFERSDRSCNSSSTSRSVCWATRWCRTPEAARTAVARGDGFVRVVFVLLVAAFTVKIGYDTWVQLAG